MRTLFVFCGAKFYLDWILIDSPSTKNPVYKFLFGWLYRNVYSECYGLKNGVGFRSVTAFFAAASHLFFLVKYIAAPPFEYPVRTFVFELLVNIYPIIVNTYVLVRCGSVLLQKRKRNFITSPVLC
jgi:hypothetical protein